MGTGIMSVVKTTTPKFEKYFTKKGTLRKKIGKPPIDLAIEFTIYAKVLQISKGRKLSHWKAWLQLTQHRNFASLMLPHFKKQKGYTKERFKNKTRDAHWILNFYKNNIVRSKIVERLNQIDFQYEETPKRKKI